MAETIGQKIKKVRIEKNLNQIGFSSELGD